MDHVQHNYALDRASHGAQGEPATGSCSSLHETAARPNLAAGEFDESMKERIRQEFANPPPGGYRNIFDQRAPTTRLLHDYVVLKFPDLPDLSAGGIVLDGKRYYGNADGSVPRDAEVVAVGPGKWVEYRARRPGGGYMRKEAWHPTTVRVGDRVLVDAMYTQEGLMSEWDGEPGDFRRVREWQIAAVLDGEVRLEVA